MRSLRARIFVAVTAAVLASIALTLGIGTLLVRNSVERSVLTGLSRQADVLAVRERNRPLDPLQLKGLGRLFGRQGVALRISPTAPSFLTDEQRRTLESGRGVDGHTSALGRDVLFAARPVGGQVLLMIRPARLGASDWRPFIRGFVLAGLIGAAIAAAASYFLARAIARPVKRVAEASRRLAAGATPAPVPVEGSAELASLASSFNDMAGEIERARESEQSFLLSVSHELKTPLTAIKGYAEALGEGAIPSAEAAEVIETEAARLERLVRDLLDLARLNRREFAVRREPVDLRSVATDAVRRYEARARSFGVELGAEGAAGASGEGDPDRVLQVVSNLVENAIRCTPAGGRVSVAAGPGSISVRDSGPGLTAEDIPRAFERFFLSRRYGAERPVGSGLGLAVVKELTEAMGGAVTVRSEPGRGATFTVSLPPVPGPAAERPAGTERPASTPI